MVRTAMGASPLSMMDWIARSMVCALVRRVRSVATDRLFLLLDIERKRTIAMVNNKNKTMNSVILMRIETFFIGNNPINSCPTVVATLFEKSATPAERGSGPFQGPSSYPQLCRWSLIYADGIYSNSGDLGHLNR